MDTKTLDVIAQLANEAIKRTVSTGKPYDLVLQPVFINMLDILSTPASSNSQRTLLLAAAHRPIIEAQNRVNEGLVHDSRLTIDQNSELVRIRMICFELKGLLDNAMEEIKKNNRRARIND